MEVDEVVTGLTDDGFIIPESHPHAVRIECKLCGKVARISLPNTVIYDHFQEQHRDWLNKYIVDLMGSKVEQSYLGQVYQQRLRVILLSKL